MELGLSLNKISIKDDPGPRQNFKKNWNIAGPFFFHTAWKFVTSFSFSLALYSTLEWWGLGAEWGQKALIIMIIFLCNGGDYNQGLEHGRQTFYHWATLHLNNDNFKNIKHKPDTAETNVGEWHKPLMYKVKLTYSVLQRNRGFSTVLIGHRKITCNTVYLKNSVHFKSKDVLI